MFGLLDLALELMFSFVWGWDLEEAKVLYRLDIGSENWI